MFWIVISRWVMTDRQGGNRELQLNCVGPYATREEAMEAPAYVEGETSVIYLPTMPDAEPVDGLHRVAAGLSSLRNVLGDLAQEQEAVLNDLNNRLSVLEERDY